MRFIQKLIRHGNSTVVSLPRPLLYQLQWIAGSWITIDINEDCTQVVLRMPTTEDFHRMKAPRLPDVDEAVK